MQDSRINYVEQHVEAMGLDSSKLENLRVSASNSSPMADTLDLCARYTDAATLEALVPRLLQLIKSGLGLNTRCLSAIIRMLLAAASWMKGHSACS
jgi:proteasome component ECM29